MVWGAQPWIKDLPYANAAYRYNFKHGESGKLVLEFFVTPFDYAPPDRSVRAVQTELEENKVIGMSLGRFSTTTTTRPTATGASGTSHTRRRCMATRPTWSRSA